MVRTSANTIAAKPARTSMEQAVKDCISETSAIAISPKPTCMSTEQTFKDCISVDVEQKLYRQIPTIFFTRSNIRMEGIFKLAAEFTKKRSKIHV